MRLHENPELFSDAIQAASEFKGIREVYIEKDYWVTLALHGIFHSEYKDVAVFKGGTALSKCHGLIKRFSEDVDIVVIQEEGESGNQLSNKIRAISKYVADILPEKNVKGITSKHGNFRKTAHEFDKAFGGEYGQVRQDIILEISSLGNYEPHTDETVSSYIAEMMLDQGQDEVIDEYDLAPFTVQVLSKSRTLCEKIMSLVRFSRSENPYEDLANKIRHIYDIHALINDPDTKAFFESDEFDTMINIVGQDDVMAYKSEIDWLKHHPQTALIYSEPEKTWEQLRSTYNSTFKDLVIGDPPDEALLIDALKTVSQRLSTVDWGLADE
jgi:predicted nucleotidyltransferase component of viral defense system